MIFLHVHFVPGIINKRFFKLDLIGMFVQLEMVFFVNFKSHSKGLFYLVRFVVVAGDEVASDEFLKKNKNSWCRFKAG